MASIPDKLHIFLQQGSSLSEILQDPENQKSLQEIFHTYCKEIKNNQKGGQRRVSRRDMNDLANRIKQIPCKDYPDWLIENPTFHLVFIATNKPSSNTLDDDPIIQQWKKQPYSSSERTAYEYLRQVSPKHPSPTISLPMGPIPSILLTNPKFAKVQYTLPQETTSQGAIYPILLDPSLKIGDIKNLDVYTQMRNIQERIFDIAAGERTIREDKDEPLLYTQVLPYSHDIFEPASDDIVPKKTGNIEKKEEETPPLTPYPSSDEEPYEYATSSSDISNQPHTHSDPLKSTWQQSYIVGTVLVTASVLAYYFITRNKKSH